MKSLWVDDLIKPPALTWRWAKNSRDAIWLLQNPSIDGEVTKFDYMSLDHDLGGEDTARPIIYFLIENPQWWPDRIDVHSKNPVGAKWLRDMIKDHQLGFM